MAQPDRLVPGGCTRSPDCGGGRAAAARRGRGRRSRRRTPCSSGATSAPASLAAASRAGARRGALAHRLGLAWRLQRGLGRRLGGSGWLLTGLAYGSIGDERRRPDRRQRGGTGRCFARAAATWSTASTRRSMLMLALLAVRLRDLLGPPAPRRGGRRSRRAAARHRPARGPRWLRGHAAVTVVGTVLVLAAAGSAWGSATPWSPGRGPGRRCSLPDLAYAAPGGAGAAGLARLLYGVAPGWRVAGWVCWPAVVVLLLGEVLRCPTGCRTCHPSSTSPLVPAEEFDLAGGRHRRSGRRRAAGRHGRLRRDLHEAARRRLACCAAS